MIDKLIKKAISFLGAKEPTGDDQFIKLYNKLTGAGFSMTVAWCAIFVTAIARMMGVSTSIIPTFASCDSGVQWFVKKKRYEKSKYYGGSYKPKKGDIIFYSSKHTQNDATHVGYIVNAASGNIKAIEGNKNDAVGYRTINENDKYIIGYGRVADFIGGSSAVVDKAQSTTSESDAPSYKAGKTYTLQVELKVRTGAGTNYAAKKHSQLTTDGKKHDKDGDGCLDKGTAVTCKEIKKVGSDIWMKTPSGWIAAYYNGNIYVK